VKDRDLVSVFYMWISNFQAAFPEETLIYPFCVLGFFVDDHLAIDAWVYVCIFLSDALVFMFFF
jgi:hypothetical protein